MEDQIITEHFRLSEFTRSSVAERNHIDNSIPKEFIPNIKKLCEQVLEPLREHFGEPVIISSGYRSPELNCFVGGVHNSQHLTGEAADIILPSTINHQLSTLREWYVWILDYCSFDQCIWERTNGRYWIHVSCKPDITQNRQHSFRIKK